MFTFRGFPPPSRPPLEPIKERFLRKNRRPQYRCNYNMAASFLAIFTHFITELTFVEASADLFTDWNQAFFGVNLSLARKFLTGMNGIELALAIW